VKLANKIKRTFNLGFFVKEISPVNYWSIIITIVLGVTIAKLIFILDLGPELWNDSYDYIEYAESIKNFSMISPDAIRTPTYPALIITSQLLFGENYYSIVIFQSILGAFSLLLIASIFGKENKNAIFISALIFLAMSQFSFTDLNILTESAATFFLLLFIRFLYYIIEKNFHFHQLILFCILIAIIILLRPQYLFVFTCLGIFLIYKKYSNIGYYILLTILIISLSYSSFNYHYNNYFGLTSLIGFNLINHTGNYVEKYNHKNSMFIDLYIETRDIRSSNGLANEMTIWPVLRILEQKEGFDRIEFSKFLTDLSFSLIINYPMDYTKSVSRAFILALYYKDMNLNPEVKKFLIPSILNSIIYFFGFIILLLTMSKKSILLKVLAIIFLSNFLISISIDVGENFRYILPVLFIPYYYFFLFMNKKLNALFVNKNNYN
jgi:4-amino-4-deoxy-L-arabinose transferase-like glycosyltransferase